MVVQHKSYPICPPWLKPLISAKFFEPCSNHSSNSSGDASSSTRIECNLFCLDCMDEPLCFGCTFCHKNHHVVQIRRSSYHDVIRVSEIQKVLDLSGVQSYIINSARVVFLNGRPQSKLAKGVTKTCEICARSLNENFRYCSLGCKLQGISKHGDLTFMLQPKPQVGNGNHRVYAEDGASHKKSRSRKAAKLDSPNSQQQQQPKITPDAPKSWQDHEQDEDDDRQEEESNRSKAMPIEAAKIEEKEDDVHGEKNRPAPVEKEHQQLSAVEIWPSTPPQPLTCTEEITPSQHRAAKRRKGTPHRSHLGSGLTLGEVRG